MTIVESNLNSKLKQTSAIACEAAMVKNGISSERFVIGAKWNSEEKWEAGVFVDKNSDNHYWCNRDNSPIEYFRQSPSTDFSPLGVPFIFRNFNISHTDLFQQNVGLDFVRKAFQAHQINFEVAGPSVIPLDEGYFLEMGANGISVFYTERGRKNLLGVTRFPWVAGLAVACLR